MVVMVTGWRLKRVSLEDDGGDDADDADGDEVEENGEE